MPRSSPPGPPAAPCPPAGSGRRRSLPTRQRPRGSCGVAVSQARSYLCATSRTQRCRRAHDVGHGLGGVLSSRSGAGPPRRAHSPHTPTSPRAREHLQPLVHAGARPVRCLPSHRPQPVSCPLSSLLPMALADASAKPGGVAASVLGLGPALGPRLRSLRGGALPPPPGQAGLGILIGRAAAVLAGKSRAAASPPLRSPPCKTPWQPPQPRGLRSPPGSPVSAPSLARVLPLRPGTPPWPPACGRLAPFPLAWALAPRRRVVSSASPLGFPDVAGGF